MSGSDKGAHWIKQATGPCSFLERKDVDKEINVNQWCLMGHNRYATMGAVNSSNAHPFEHGNITLMHNGTLDDWSLSSLRRKYSAPMFDTDSETIAWLFDNYNPKDIVAELEGAYALTWWDDRDNSINFVNNGEREFHISIQQGNAYWGSEKKMVEWIGDRTNTVVDKVDTVFQPDMGEYIKLTYDKTTRLITEHRETWDYIDPKTSWGSGYGNSWQSKFYPKKKKNFTPSIPSQFKEDYGIDISVNATLYGTLKKVTPNQCAGYVNLHFKMCVHPFSTLIVNYIRESEVKLEAGDYARLTVSYHYGRDDDLRIVCQSYNMRVLSTQSDWEKYEGWLEANTFEDDVVFESGNVIELPQKFTGFRGELIEWDEFQAVLDKGCALCASPLDAESEKLEQTSVFIDPTACICEDCAGNAEALKEFNISIGEFK